MKIWVAVDTVENKKRYAHVWSFSSDYNMITTFKSLQRAEIIHLCKSKKEASEIVKQWNEIHKKNGVYMFDDLLF